MISSAGISSSFWQRPIPYALKYDGHTGFETHGARAALKFAPNLKREKVAFDGVIKDPLKLREAMAMLHAVVVSDLRFKKDRTAYKAYLERVAAEEKRVRDAAGQAAKDALHIEKPRAGLKEDHKVARKRYWQLRTRLERELAREDPELFRMLVPCDPVVTVAPDVVMFEGFAKDESSYGCVIVERDAFSGAQDAVLGTTNVDYSLALAGEMERMRSYRETRFAIDPQGIEVETGGTPSHREEKIELPATWLKGFGQLSSALMMPARNVKLPVEQLYTVLSHLRTHREKQGPRALRFILEPGKPPAILMEPWGIRVESHGPIYDGERSETIAMWGRRRLMSLGRALAIAQASRGNAAGPVIDVKLLGSGLPSIWSVDLGGVRAVLALSGWTTNDWSGGARLDLLAGGAILDEDLTQRVAALLQQKRTLRINEIALETKASQESVRASVVRLAQLGQLVPDLTTGAVRFRMVIDAPLSAELLGDEPHEITEGKRIFSTRQVRIERDEPVGEKRFVQGHAGAIECEALIDRDGVMTRASCRCSHFHRFGIRKGPCRHLLALRLFAVQSVH